MTARLPRLSFAALSLFAALAASAHAADIASVKLSTGEEYTRAVFAVSGPLDYKLFGLEGPSRVVVDIKGAQLGKTFSATSEGVVRSVRTGKLNETDLRVVLDLDAKVKPRSFMLPPDPKEGLGHRLVIDLYREHGAAVAPPVVRTVEQVKPSSDRDVIVSIDAGHGGNDPGARGHSGTWEKNVTLEVARELKRQIDAEPGMRAVLTRDGDVFIPLEGRYRKARDAKADLFISIHADAFHKKTASGSSVFVLTQRGASSQAARWLADRENAADLVGGVKLVDKDNTLAAVLLDLSQSATMRASGEVANQVLSAMRQVGKTHKPHVESANFVVLRSPDVPSILVETAFISNPAEEKRLNDPAHRRKLATAILGGVRNYFHLQPPPGTWIAANAKPASREHVVSRGETLSLIAARHGVKLQALRAANTLRGDVVKVGDRLRIPLAMGPG